MADSHTLIESQVLTGAVTSIDFTSIPSGYSHLKLYCAGPGNNNTWLGMRFNDNSTSGHYRGNHVTMEGNAGTMYGNSGSLSHIFLGQYYYSTDSANTCEITIPYYRSSYYKYVMFRSGHPYNWYGGCGEWINTSAITKITLFADTNGMREHGQYSLFGLD